MDLLSNKFLCAQDTIFIYIFFETSYKRKIRFSLLYYQTVQWRIFLAQITPSFLRMRF
jgi:hypothetical protein